MKEIKCSFGIDIDSVAGWIGSYGGQDSPSDIQRGVFATEVGVPRLLRLFEKYDMKSTFFIPGHTKGHIAFFFKKEKIAFTGDTLFSLGCGRVFEGTHEEMFNSLNKLKNLPPDTKIYCGHEYTKSNFNFCLKHDPNNIHLKNKKIDIEKKLNSNQPTIPSTIADELKTNIFQ